jgi:ParB family chromosome partitioning protein
MEIEVPLLVVGEPEKPLRATIDAEGIARLADDIAANGLLQRVGVRGPSPDGRYQIVWGHRRLLALRLLGALTVPARVYAWEHDPLMLAIAENQFREEQSPVEEGENIVRLVDRGYPLPHIARVYRRSVEWVEGRLALMQYPEDLRAAVHERRVSLAVAFELRGVDHAPYRAQLVAEAERAGATARTVRVWAAHYEADKARIAANQLTVEQIAAARESFKLYVPCDLCREDHPFDATRSLRVCNPCLGAVLELVEREAGAAASQSG